MDHWNHRVVKRTSKYKDHNKKEIKEVYYRIEECYYSEKGKVPHSTTDGLIIQGESVKDLEWTLKQMLKCLKNPIINGDKLKNAK